MSLRARICLAGFGLSVVWAVLGHVPHAEAQNGAEPEAHPLLTENEYRIVSEQGQKSAAARAERKRTRLAELAARRDSARAVGDGALEAQVAAVTARLETGSPPLDEQERWARKHGRRMTLRGLWSRYGKQLHQPAVVAEFDAHAWRMARLERSRHVAQTLEDAARRERILAEVDALVAAESERHRAALEALLQSAAAPPIGVSVQAHGATISAPSQATAPGAVSNRSSVPGAQSPSAQPSAGGPNP